MKVIIAGGRDFIPLPKHKSWLIRVLSQIEADTVICGMAKGADTFGMMVALQNNLTVLKYPADWDKYGKSAGYRRNVEMAKVADACILFPGGKGTEHMKNIAIEYNLKLIEYKE
jgi:hypothetical protein